MDKLLLEVKDLRVEFDTELAMVYAVNGIDLKLEHGDTLGLVGETGAGKTTLCKAILRILPDDVSKIPSGSITLEGRDILGAPESVMRNIRGKEVCMIFQEPMSALNPVMTVGDQIGEVIRTHNPAMKKAEVEARVDQMMELVGIEAFRKKNYPHEFSGGMKQRIVIAIALACEPKLILADEPTTALDVTIQAQMLALIHELQERLNTAMILVTHDFGVVAQTCKKVMVMYGGEAVEVGSVEDIFEGPYLHPYTKGLLNAIPNLDVESDRLETIDGMMPDPTVKPSGCQFKPRCKYACDGCDAHPSMQEINPGHMIRCHRRILRNGGVEGE
ncbi:MAG: ABC transporter ATP-binding protein [Clostridia bacterium]|nr:ABC transporter ATP-binding protein [Clostridia bacterium]